MRERVLQLKGEMRIQSPNGGGMVLEVVLPWQEYSVLQAEVIGAKTGPPETA